MQKYRSDYGEPHADGSTHWFANWMDGPTLARINKCRIYGSSRRLAVYITGEPDTFFSIPAVTRCRSKRVPGYITSDDEGLIFHPMDSHKHLLEG